VTVDPSFGREGSTADAQFTPAAGWIDALCGWVRRSPGDLGPLAWPVVLMPQRIGSAFALPDDARTVYQRVRWDASLPDGPMNLEARTAGVTSDGTVADAALTSAASAAGVRLAESEVVVRTARSLPAWGQVRTSPAPDVVGAERRLSFALSEHDVADFAELTGVHEAIHEDAAHAWRLGLANAVVQELTLLLIVMQFAGAASPGGVEMWFPAPVPVGSLLTLWQSGDAWEVRLAATNGCVAVGRVVGVGRPNGRCAFASSKG
jgi:acyl dehydratase